MPRRVNYFCHSFVTRGRQNPKYIQYVTELNSANEKKDWTKARRPKLEVQSSKNKDWRPKPNLEALKTNARKLNQSLNKDKNNLGLDVRLNIGPSLADRHRLRSLDSIGKDFTWSNLYAWKKARSRAAAAAEKH